MGDTGSAPPRVTNLLDLLKVSLAHSDASSAQEAPSTPNTLDPERAQWLREAFQSLSVDIAGTLKEAIMVLGTESTKVSSESKSQEDALDTILNCTDNIDFAKDFLKLGGLCVTLTCLDSSHDSVRSRAAELLAQLTQNHLYCQKEVLKAGGLKILMRVVTDDPANEVRVKAFYALSCLIRTFDEGIDAFVENDGCSLLLRCIQSDNKTLRIKSLFLLNAICFDSTKLRITLAKMGIVDQLIADLRMPHDEAHTFIASILTCLVSEKSCLKDLKKPELQTPLLLEEKMLEIQGQEEFQDEYDYYRELKKLCAEGIDDSDR